MRSGKAFYQIAGISLTNQGIRTLSLKPPLPTQLQVCRAHLASISQQVRYRPQVWMRRNPPIWWS